MTLLHKSQLHCSGLMKWWDCSAFVSAALLAEEECGTGTQISGSGSSSSSGRYNFGSLLAPDPEQFGPKNHKKHHIICISRLPHKLRHKISLWNRNPNFRLRFHHLKVFGSGSSHPKLLLLRLHLHSPVAEASCETYLRIVLVLVFIA